MSDREEHHGGYTMRTVGFGLVAIITAAAAGTTPAADDSKDLIVGLWEIVYSDAAAIPTGTKLEFTSEGRVKIFAPGKNGSDTALDAGGYKLDKDILTLTGTDGQKNDKGRICLLNKSSLVVNDELED
jgi:uncharacterized protein (TIGR03066 family)